MGKGLALLSCSEHHHADFIHGWRRRLECSHLRRRADVPGPEGLGPHNRTRCVPGRAPRIQDAFPHQRPPRTPVRLAEPLRKAGLRPCPPPPLPAPPEPFPAPTTKPTD